MVNSVDFHDFLIWIRLWMAANETLRDAHLVFVVYWSSPTSATLLPWTCGSFWYGMVTIPICSSYLPTYKDLNIHSPFGSNIQRLLVLSNPSPRCTSRRGSKDPLPLSSLSAVPCMTCPFAAVPEGGATAFELRARWHCDVVPLKGAWVNGKHHGRSLLNHKEDHLEMDIMNINIWYFSIARLHLSECVRAIGAPQCVTIHSRWDNEDLSGLDLCFGAFQLTRHKMLVIT